jgi:competence protein ComEA
MLNRLLLLLVSLALFAPATVARADEPAGDATEAKLLDINLATAEELTRLPGIGPAKAKAIVDYRSRRRFHSPAAIQRVKGIGRATYLRLRPLITVGNR